MVGFSSDTDEDSTIEEIISQAQDSILLKQISAINCSSFTHSDLPSDLESRFLKLKSFPANHTTPPPYHPKPPTFSTSNSTKPQKSIDFSPSQETKSIKNPDSDSGSVSSPSDSSHEKKGPKPKPKNGSFSPSDSVSVSSPSNSVHEKKGPNPKPKPKNGSFTPSDSSHTSEESSMSSLFMPLQRKKDEEKQHSKVKFVSPSPSPPRKWGCFWCSPKKEKKKQSKENDDVVGSLEEYTSDEFLSDIGSLSTRKRMNMIEKALKEEQKKIDREAEKIVELVKHASARMNISDIEDEFSDD